MVSLRQVGDVVARVAVDRLQVEHFAGSLPWRRFRSRHGQAHLSGAYWAATTGGHVVYESRLELARLLLADFDPQVAGIWSQPCLLTASVGGKPRRHVPDFLLVSPGGVATVVNVKPADRLSDPRVAERLDWPGRLLKAHGWRYEVWSGCESVLLDNVRFLAAYRRPGVVVEAAVRRAWDAVADGEALGAVELRLAGPAPGWTARPGLLALLWRHRLVTDLSRPLSAASVLRRCG